MSSVGEHPAIERVRAHAAGQGLALDVRRFPAGTHTAEDAARAIGCDVAQIVKSLVLLAQDELLLVLISGADRIDEAKVATALAVPSVRRATAKEARERTGFVVGGIPPFGHTAVPMVLIDAALLDHSIIWAAAGLPDAVFPISPADLQRASGARVTDLRLAAAADRPAADT